MSETTPATATPVIDVPVDAPKVEAKQPDVTPERSPAQDLKNIQELLVVGIYPGQMAPAVVKAYSLLDAMIKQVEGASVEQTNPA